MAPLDGKETIKPTPFDAHEQVARVQHEEAPKQPDYAHSGLRVVDAEDAVTEFPKAVDHVQKAGAPEGHQEPIVANSQDEEDEYHEQKAAAAAEQQLEQK